MIQKGEGVILSSTEFRALLEKVNGQLHISLPLYIKNNLDDEEDDWELKVLHIEGITSSDEDFSDYIKDETVDFSPIFSFGSYPELQRNVGRNLKQQLADQGITQKEAAQRLGITDSAMSQIINGQVSLNIESLLMIQAKLNISLEDITKNIKWDMDSFAASNPLSVPANQSELMDWSPFRKIMNDLLKQYSETELKSLLRKLAKLSDKIDKDYISQPIKELDTLLKQDALHQEDEDKGFKVDNTVLESYQHIIEQLRKALASYPAGIETTLNDISVYLDFIIKRNKNHKQAD
ncbi:helix-turn-helix domain-containing protein [Paenibacillus silvae]|uniref:helix-turn-helix domain-containing protein n=1 Tax=Paenibacillus silvae TaxID=1325358 RepID=UPI002004C4F6|nr:helix-turn-helix transcriptional regulator [Paenibacillus silvae]MCK6075371.1 helix-turn-helix domain-containing protein [Paenibacillus silvae]MCK6149758.1 helix-turn-helix domain-containing protein [Paenibacillus silvae]MCK6268056.1 helix-turn-helix domain-containing protein [Paenibacillus silvae]